jgi:hypothetical protein
MGREWQRVGLGNDSRRGWLAVHGQWTLQPNSLLSGSGLGWAAKARPSATFACMLCRCYAKPKGFAGCFARGMSRSKPIVSGDWLA